MSGFESLEQVLKALGVDTKTPVRCGTCGNISRSEDCAKAKEHVVCTSLDYLVDVDWTTFFCVCKASYCNRYGSPKVFQEFLRNHIGCYFDGETLKVDRKGVQSVTTRGALYL